MAFIRILGWVGKVYVPDQASPDVKRVCRLPRSQRTEPYRAVWNKRIKH
jgi:hypothetical protein